MSLFNFGKKKKAPTCGCCGGGGKQTANSCCTEAGGKLESVKVLGAGCSACHQQYEYAKEAVASMGFDVEVEYITDMEKVMQYGVMSMPAIVVNEKVASMGKVLKASDVEKLLRKLGF